MHENDDKASSITLSTYGESMHIAPDGKEGYLYTAEEVYEMLQSKQKNFDSGNKKSNAKRWDDHSQWGKFEEDSKLRDVWVKNFAECCEAIKVRDASNNRGTLPMFARRMLE